MSHAGCQAAPGGCSYPNCPCETPLPRTMEQKAERPGETRTVVSDYLDRNAGATNERFRKPTVNLCSCGQAPGGCNFPTCGGKG